MIQSKPASPTLQYLELAKSVVEINKANGFDPSTWENFPVKIACILTEIDEARDEYGGYGFKAELADIAIRLLDTLHGVWPHGWCARQHGGPWPYECNSIGKNLWLIIEPISKAVEAWRKGERTDALIHTERALLACRRIAECYDVDLPHEIAAKLKYNKTRGFLHGKKRSEG